MPADTSRLVTTLETVLNEVYRLQVILLKMHAISPLNPQPSPIPRRK